MEEHWFHWSNISQPISSHAIGPSKKYVLSSCEVLVIFLLIN